MNQVVKEQFANVYGYKEVKEELKRIIGWFNDPEKLNDKKVVLPKGVLLYGDPGNGKTLFVREIKSSFSYPIFEIKGKDENVAEEIIETFTKAKAEKFSIIIIDEIDLLIDKDNKVKRALQQEMDGISDSSNILVLATCNYIHDLPDALLRPGRLDRKIEINDPDCETREEMFRHFLDKLEIDTTKINVTRVAKNANCNAATIQAICNDAYLRCGSNVTTRDLEKSYDRIERGNLKDNRTLRDYRVAIHEAGHVLATLASKNNYEFYEASFANYGGYTETNPVDENKDTISKREENIVISLAGYIAEETLLGRHDVGSYKDYQRAHDNVTRLIERVCIKGISHLIPAYDDNRDRYETPLKRFINELYVHRLLNKYVRKTKRLIRRNKEVVREIADKLYENGIFTYLDAENVIVRQ